MERLALEAQHQKQESPFDSPVEQERTKIEKSLTARPKKYNKSANTSLNSSSEFREGNDKKSKKKGQKLYCICRTPYDKSK